MVHALCLRPKTSAGHLPTADSASSDLLCTECISSPAFSPGNPPPRRASERLAGHDLAIAGLRTSTRQPRHPSRLATRSLSDIFARDSRASFPVSNDLPLQKSSQQEIDQTIDHDQSRVNEQKSRRLRAGLEEAKGAISAMARKALQSGRESRPVDRLNSLNTHDSSMSGVPVMVEESSDRSSSSSSSRDSSAPRIRIGPSLAPSRRSGPQLMTRPLTRLRTLRDKARRNAISLRAGHSYATSQLLQGSIPDELLSALPQQQSSAPQIQPLCTTTTDEEPHLQPMATPIAPGSAARASAAEHNSRCQPQNSSQMSLAEGLQSIESFESLEKMTKKRRAGKGRIIGTGESVDLGCESGIDEFTERRRSKPPTRIDLIGKLPTEIAADVLSYLDDTQLRGCLRVSRRWNQIATTPAVWRASFLGRYSREEDNVLPYVQFGGQGLGREASSTSQEWQKMSQARKRMGTNWTMMNPKAVYFTGHTDSVYCCQFDEDKIITGSRDRTIRVWDLNAPYTCRMVIGGPNAKPTRPATEALLETHPTNTVFSTPNLNGTAAGDAIYHVPTDYHTASILCLQFDKEVMVTGSSDHSCIVWDIKTFQPIRRLLHHTAGVLDVCMDDQYIISCSKDAHICVWDRATFTLIKALHGHRGPVNAVQLRVVDGKKLLVSASGDGLAKIWDLEKLEVKQQFNSQDRGLAAVEFSDDGKYVLAGGNDQVIYKFCTKTANLMHTFRGHSSLVRSLFLDSANGRVVSGSYDQGIRVYDFESGNLVGAYDNWTTSWILAAKGDYRRIVATSQDGRALLMDFGWGIKDAELLSGLDPNRPRTGSTERENEVTAGAGR